MLYPPQDPLSNVKRPPIKLYRRLYVPVAAMDMISTEVYQDKRPYIALFAFEVRARCIFFFLTSAACFFFFVFFWGVLCDMVDSIALLPVFVYGSTRYGPIFADVLQFQ